MTSSNGHNPGKSVFTSQQISTLTVMEIERRKNNPRDGIKTGIDVLDSILLPFRPGELIPVLGNTSNYKSGLMMYMARAAVQQIDAENEIVLYCTWEQSVEEQGMVEIAQASRIPADKLARGDLTIGEWKQMMKAAMERAVFPLWHIGHSSQSGERRPRLGMSDLARALDYVLDDMQFSPIVIVLDYLQRIRRETGNTAREQYMEIVDRAKDMALAFSCPVVLGTQAGRHVLDRKWKMPQMHDSQETSNLEQSADKFLSVWLPKTSEMIGDRIGPNDEFVVSDNLLLVSVLKQKFGPAPKTFAFHVEPQINEIYKFERMGI